MKYKNETTWNTLIYILIIILIILIGVNFYNILKNKNYTENSINVFPTKRGINENDSNSILEVEYIDNFIFKLPQITEADLVYQWYDLKNETLRYSAIFYNKKIKSNDSINKIFHLDFSDVPSTKFINSTEMQPINFTDGGEHILIKFNNKIAFKLVYKDGLYYVVDKSTTNNPISFMNIVIINLCHSNYQLLPYNKKHLDGTGIVFSNGKFKNTLLRNNLLIYEDSSKQIPLMEGSTLWIFLSSTDELIYTK